MIGRAALALALAGCATHSSRHAARAVAPGAWRAAIAADALVFEHGRRYTVYPAPELSVRRGMGAGWDLGGKVGAGSVEASARFALVARPGYAVALAPGARFAFALLTNNERDLLRATGFGHALIEARVGARVALVGTATAAVTVAGDATDTRALAEPALGLGVRVGLGRWVLWPEVSATLPYVFGEGLEAPLIQAGVALER